MAVNCGALPEALLGSELVGHKEGAFAGATRSRRGCFELADNGTLFPDEIGDMPDHLQVKLPPVLQEHELQRVGGEKPVTVDVRVMAASNRDPEAEVEAKQFRKYLCCRLSVVCLRAPRDASSFASATGQAHSVTSSHLDGAERRPMAQKATG